MPLSPDAKIIFATKHRKNEIFASVFKPFGWHCVAEEVDTDLLGTFSGEIERRGTVRETLRGKMALAHKIRSNESFFLASEGSYIPHPHLGFMSIGVESLLFWDAKKNFEIYCEFIDHHPVHEEQLFASQQGVHEFLEKVGFPQQAVILHPEKTRHPLFKGINNKMDFDKAFLDCLKRGESVKVATDLRAMMSPRRQWALQKAAEKLVEYLSTDCPKCQAYGFGFYKGHEGLPCEDCQMPSRLVSALVFRCPHCMYEESRKRPDGLELAPAENCDHCNP